MGDQRLDSLLAVRQHDQTPDGVLQLANVARPRVFPEPRKRFWQKLLLPTVLAVELGQEPDRQHRNFVAPLPERRHPDLHHIEPVVEILSELAALHRVFQVAVGRRDHTRVDVDHSMAADAREPEILEHVEELSLQREGKLGDLVEVDRALVRVLELARFASMRAGEGPLLMPEELGLE